MNWAYNDLKCLILRKSEQPISSKKGRTRVQIDVTAKLFLEDKGSSFFRIRSQKERNQIKVTLRSTTFRGLVRELVGKSIFFMEGVALKYYHPISIYYDPNDPDKITYVRNEVDLPFEIKSNFEIKTHKQIYGDSVPSKATILCAVVKRTELEEMVKLFFLERIAPILEVQNRQGESKSSTSWLTKTNLNSV